MGVVDDKIQNKVREDLKKYGLNWTVRTEPIQTVSGIAIPKRIAVLRNDNDVTLGIHSKGYETYQNEELLNLLYLLSEKSGLNVHSAGSFGGGEKVWFQLESGYHRMGGDVVQGYISGINSFDGSTALALGNLVITISCQNSFWAGYKSMDTRLIHSISLRTKIDEILFKIEKLVENENLIFAKVDRLRTVGLSQAVKELVIRKMFDLKNEDRLDTIQQNPNISGQKKNKLSQFYVDMDGELLDKGETLWGMFSAVTKYTTHSLKKGHNEQSKMIGVTGIKERKIWNELVEIT